MYGGWAGASQARVKGFGKSINAWVLVGAGLPAMLAPRCDRHTGVMLSQASQLPQGRRQASE
ncbi:hypothetical protein C1751_17025 [Pseudomonas fluorescens]|nr:hypothetical protein C1751_17025 [Pseudomonas fluorescens]